MKNEPLACYAVLILCLNGKRITDGSIKYVYSYQAFDMQMLVLKEWEIHWPADIPSEEKHRNLREKREINTPWQMYYEYWLGQVLPQHFPEGSIMFSNVTTWQYLNANCERRVKYPRDTANKQNTFTPPLRFYYYYYYLFQHIGNYIIKPLKQHRQMQSSAWESLLWESPYFSQRRLQASHRALPSTPALNHWLVEQNCLH